MSIKHQIKSSTGPLPDVGGLIGQLGGLIAQAQALFNAGVGLPGLQSIGSQLSALSSSISSTPGAEGIGAQVQAFGTQMSTATMAQMSGILSALNSALSGLQNLLNPNNQFSDVLHSHILEKAQGIIHSAFQGQHTVQLGSDGISVSSSQKVTTTAPRIPHNGLTLVSDALQVTLGITAQGFGLLSDERLKSNIALLGPVLEKVLRLRVKTFDVKALNYETGEVMPTDPTPSIGLIAQELRKEFPGMVRDGQYMSIDHDKLLMVLLAAVIELAAEVRGK